MRCFFCPFKYFFYRINSLPSTARSMMAGRVFLVLGRALANSATVWAGLRLVSFIHEVLFIRN